MCLINLRMLDWKRFPRVLQVGVGQVPSVQILHEQDRNETKLNHTQKALSTCASSKIVHPPTARVAVDNFYFLYGCVFYAHQRKLSRKGVSLGKISERSAASDSRLIIWTSRFQLTREMRNKVPPSIWAIRVKGSVSSSPSWARRGMGVKRWTTRQAIDLLRY